MVQHVFSLYHSQIRHSPMQLVSQCEQSTGAGGAASHVTASAVGPNPTMPPSSAVAKTTSFAERMRKLRRPPSGGHGACCPRSEGLRQSCHLLRSCVGRHVLHAVRDPLLVTSKHVVPDFKRRGVDHEDRRCRPDLAFPRELPAQIEQGGSVESQRRAAELV